MDAAKQNFAVIIPAKNEELSVAAVVTAFFAAFRSLNCPVDVIVVDDHSDDATRIRADAAGARVIALTEKGGLAEAFRSGTVAALAAGAEYIVQVDADGQYSAEDLPRLVSRALVGGDLVLGNRLWRRPDGMSATRYFANCAFSRLVAGLSLVSIADSQSGYRIFTRQVAVDCPIATDYTYTQEQVLRAGRAGFAVSDVPVTFSVRQHGTSRLIPSVVKYSWRVILSVHAVCRSLGIPAHCLLGRAAAAILLELRCSWGRYRCTREL
ncbi:glycosyltransferase family 2 protein [Dactylosporangium sp. CA-139114]|uniref:glycosyltransferase family 2 protein n=1 Tax=Dactylosporangium sp. CA-139114 TaxID=3239931 RepID=UPI003D957079